MFSSPKTVSFTELMYLLLGPSRLSSLTELINYLLVGEVGQVGRVVLWGFPFQA